MRKPKKSKAHCRVCKNKVIVSTEMYSKKSSETKGISIATSAEAFYLEEYKSWVCNTCSGLKIW